MNKLFFAVIFIFTAGNSLFSQSTFPVFRDSLLQSNRLLINGNFDATGTSMKKEFVNTLAFGGYIDSEMKDRTLKSHRANNRFGTFGSGEITYVSGATNLFKSGKYSWLVKGGYYLVGNVNYTKDAFKLTFYGNSYLGADTANLTGTRISGMQFQKAGFGFYHKKTGSSLTLNVVNVQNQFGGYIRTGKLSQDPNLDSISLRLNGDMTYSKGKEFSKGLGFVVDFDFYLKVPWLKDSATFQFSIQNLGAAYMFEPQTQYSADSTYRYSGFTLDQIKNNGNLFGDDFSLLDSLNIEKKEVKRWVMVPAYIQIMKLVDLESAKKLQSFFGIRFYPTIGIVPTGFVGLFYRFVPRVSVSANAAFGGSSIVRGGLMLGYHGNKVGVQLGTDDIYGLVSKKGYGQSALIRLSWVF
ncbi:MAG: hypothetical protein K0S23_1101 [Fluviicola sp.]|jgi:hypothetical protein|uniref:DUF5723 family protein n=1 Tax=Fluviicola sp. TaxID=1917219 RepID=UPI002629A2E2|nr:DUF5723 family protein [Fluviicola sp.]MDF3026794.1 hypothetical protein [Fluviicola sp.]